MSNETIKIKQGQYFKAKSIVEDANGDVIVTDIDGILFDPIPKQQTRQTFSKDLLTVAVYDVILDNYFWAVTNELEDGTGVISAVDAATDKTAVQAYLSTFVGKI